MVVHPFSNEAEVLERIEDAEVAIANKVVLDGVARATS